MNCLLRNIKSYSKPYNLGQTNGYLLETLQLLVLDRNTWNRSIVWDLIVLYRIILYYITMLKIKTTQKIWMNTIP